MVQLAVAAAVRWRGCWCCVCRFAARSTREDEAAGVAHVAQCPTRAQAVCKRVSHRAVGVGKNWTGREGRQGRVVWGKASTARTSATSGGPHIGDVDGDLRGRESREPGRGSGRRGGLRVCGCIAMFAVCIRERWAEKGPRHALRWHCMAVHVIIARVKGVRANRATPPRAGLRPRGGGTPSS